MESLFCPSLAARRKNPRFLLFSHKALPGLVSSHRACHQGCCSGPTQSPTYSLKQKYQLPTNQQGITFIYSQGVKVWQRKTTTADHGWLHHRLCCTVSNSPLHFAKCYHRTAWCRMQAALSSVHLEKVQERTNAHFRVIPPMLQPCGRAAKRKRGEYLAEGARPCHGFTGESLQPVDLLWTPSGTWTIGACGEGTPNTAEISAVRSLHFSVALSSVMIFGKCGLHRRGNEFFLPRMSQKSCSSCQSEKRTQIKISSVFDEHLSLAPTCPSAGGDTNISSTHRCETALSFNKCNQAVD